MTYIHLIAYHTILNQHLHIVREFSHQDVIPDQSYTSYKSVYVWINAKRLSDM